MTSASCRGCAGCIDWIRSRPEIVDFGTTGQRIETKGELHDALVWKQALRSGSGPLQRSSGRCLGDLGTLHCLFGQRAYALEDQARALGNPAYVLGWQQDELGSSTCRLAPAANEISNRQCVMRCVEHVISVRASACTGRTNTLGSDTDSLGGTATGFGTLTNAFRAVICAFWTTADARARETYRPHASHDSWNSLPVRVR